MDESLQKALAEIRAVREADEAAELEVAKLAAEAAHKEFWAKAKTVAVALVGTHYDGFACHCLACKSAREIIAETEKEAQDDAK